MLPLIYSRTKIRVSQIMTIYELRLHVIAQFEYGQIYKRIYRSVKTFWKCMQKTSNSTTKMTKNEKMLKKKFGSKGLHRYISSWTLDIIRTKLLNAGLLFMTTWSRDGPNANTQISQLSSYVTCNKTWFVYFIFG